MEVVRDLAAATAPLVVSSDGDEWVLGRPDIGVYVDVPEPGAVFVQSLQSGESVAEATARASEVAGEPVDGEDFIAVLTDAGLLDLPTPPGAVTPPAAPVRGRQIRWIEGVSPHGAQRLFGRVAWTIYGLAALGSVAILFGRPDLRPTFESVWFLGDPVVSLLASVPIFIVIGATHEGWHWLAGRALGVPAVFRLSYRGVFLVFETDLTQIVTRPRRQRYGPFLAGMAIECCMLFAILLLRILYLASVVDLPAVVDRIFGALVYGLVFSIAWQWAAVFLRSDGYAILANALRCRNLYRVTWVTVKAHLFRLSDDEAAELADAHPRDRSVARWFGLVYVAGMIAMVWIALELNLPFLISMLTWLAGNLIGGAVQTRQFWESAAVATYVLITTFAPLALAIRERRLRRAGTLQ